MPTSESLSRRAFLGMTAALPFAAAALKAAARKVPVGLELYSVRDELAKDLPGTIAAVGKMGYEVVEFYAPYLTWTTETAKDVRKRLDDLGVKCHSTHNNGPSFTDEGLKKAIELNQILGSKYLIMASAPRATGIDAWKTVAQQLTSISEKLKPLGLATGYHNHQVEWRPLEGQRPMDVIAASPGLTTLVASRRPPRPTSSTAMRTPASRNRSKPAAVAHSKKVGGVSSVPDRCRPSTAVRTRPCAPRSTSVATSASPMTNRSSRRSRCGEV